MIKTMVEILIIVNVAELDANPLEKRRIVGVDATPFAVICKPKFVSAEELVTFAPNMI